MRTMTVDGRKLEAPVGSTILDVAAGAGIRIPAFCCHPDLRPSGSCGMCAVEISGPAGQRIALACSTQAAAGMEVRTCTPAIIEARRRAAAALLARAPGSEAVRRIAAEAGVDAGQRGPGDGKCIACGNCAQACREIAGAGIIGAIGSGAGMVFGISNPGDAKECLLCGACAQACPACAIDMDSRAAAVIRMSGGRLSCKYEKMGLVSGRLCSSNYRCKRCEFDQNMRDAFGSHPAFVARVKAASGLSRIDDFLFDPACEYGPGHMWSRRVNGVIRVGMDDIARRILGPISGVELAHGRGSAEPVSISVVSRNGRKTTLAFPVPGSVESVNPLLSSDPSAPTRDPYGRGWLFDFLPDRAVPRAVRRFSGRTASLWFRKEAHEIKRILGMDRRSRGGDGAFLWIDDRIIGPGEWSELTGVLLTAEAQPQGVSPR